MSEAESRFLLLAARPGNESLRRECPCISAWRDHGNMLPLTHDPCTVCYTSSGHALHGCETCLDDGWLPLLEAERMGALVLLALGLGLNISLAQRTNGKTVCELHREEHPFDDDVLEDAPTPEAALTEVLLAVAEFERQAQP